MCTSLIADYVRRSTLIGVMYLPSVVRQLKKILLNVSFSSSSNQFHFPTGLDHAFLLKDVFDHVFPLTNGH